MEQKEVSKKELVKQPDFVKWFYELDKESGNTAGGKGANLAEIYNLKMPVPPGFVVTAQAYDYFIEKAGIREKIKEILEAINYEDTAQLDESTKQIRELIVNSEFPKEMQDEVLESYNDLGFGKQETKGHAADILKAGSDPVFVAVRSSATAEDLASASFAGQQDSFVNVKGNSSLIEHIKKAFASLYTSRATYYRNKKGFKHEEVSLAVVIQKMVDSDKSGVMFTKDPAHKNENTIIEAVFGLGEGIVSGKISPDKYILSPDLEITDKKIANKKIALTRDSSGEKETVKLKEEISKSQVLKNHEIVKIADYGLKLEKHYEKPQDIEFAIENDEIFIVQTRPITTIESRFEGAKDIQGDVVLTGIAASPGIASGKIKIINTMADLPKIQKGDILVTKMTNPDMVVTMQKSAGIVTDEGGMTAHAAIVSREMGIPAIVGTQEATTKLKEGEIITVDGYHGKIYKGKVAESEQKEVLPIVAETKTKIKVIVDLPTFAERAAKSKANSVGLTRMEGIIAESGKHPNYFLRKDTLEDYEDIIFRGISGIAKYFEEIWVRTSDIRSDEYANLEGAPSQDEANPMLGMHGLRFSLKNPKIFKAELNGLKKVAEQGKKIGLLLPQVISVEEIQKVKEILKEIEFTDAKVGVMVETPASVQIIKELCEEKIDFASFGTNDLTQYTLAIDRGNENVQYLFNEVHPAILHQLEYVIKVCKEYNVESSICGQAGSKKEMVKELVKYGINSISVNADMAKEISEYVAELEQGQSEEEIEQIAEKEEKEEKVEQNQEIKEELQHEKEMEEKQEESSEEIEPPTQEEEPTLEPINEKPQEQIPEPEETEQPQEEETPEVSGLNEEIINETKPEEIPEVNTSENNEFNNEESESTNEVEPSVPEIITEQTPSESEQISGEVGGKKVEDKRQEIESLTTPSEPQEETNEPSDEEINYNKKQDKVLEQEESLDIF